MDRGFMEHYFEIAYYKTQMSAKCYSGQKISLKIGVKCYNARTFQKNLRRAAGNGRPPRSIL